MKLAVTLMSALFATNLYAPNARLNSVYIIPNYATATIYNAVESQTNSDPFHTAFMFHIDSLNPFKHKIIAVSRDLLKDFPNGTKVIVEGTDYDGIYTVRDKMNKRYANRIDILINEDMGFGKWDNVKLIKL